MESNQSDPIAPSDLDRVFLLPGEYHVTKRPKFVATLLGSCVAVCVYHKTNGSAAMNHFLHAQAESAGETSIGRFGDLATKHIIDTLFRLDANPKNYEAKIFGGGNVVSHIKAGLSIGKRNIDIAEAVLKKYGITVVERKVGGTQGVKIYFNTRDHSVTVRSVGKKQKDYSQENVRVLVVDDSPLVRNILTQVIDQSPGLEVVGEAKDAFEARDLIVSFKPDVVSLDIIMPRLDGLKFLAKLMKFNPLPVVIVSTIAKDKSEIEAQARKIGAVGVIDKDSLEIYKGLDKAMQTYIPMLKTAARTTIRR